MKTAKILFIKEIMFRKLNPSSSIAVITSSIPALFFFERIRGIDILANT